ncbi:MAG: Mut7-C RNAse domain-containing protein [Verrucomicrobiae bacterium]|nr:Mut7-C RNAse domain-containing protein [Verrucomicrobiae bacterium]
MGKIEKAFENLFRESLILLNARKIEKGLQILFDLSQRDNPFEIAPSRKPLLDTYFRIRKSVRKFKNVLESKKIEVLEKENDSIKFVCDAGLGGLTRWLWACGHQAVWNPEISDDELVLMAKNTSSILLTTDSMLFERRLLRDKIIKALWIPPTVKPKYQLLLVFDYFDLHVRDPRCMKCGGVLKEVPKEMVLHRIPPRTLKWINEYYVCVRCDSLFWRGTHWKRITPIIDELRNSMF